MSSDDLVANEAEAAASKLVVPAMLDAGGAEVEPACKLAVVPVDWPLRPDESEAVVCPLPAVLREAQV